MGPRSRRPYQFVPVDLRQLEHYCNQDGNMKVARGISYIERVQMRDNSIYFLTKLCNTMPFINYYGFVSTFPLRFSVAQINVFLSFLKSLVQDILQKASGVLRSTVQGTQKVGKSEEKVNGDSIHPISHSTQKSGLAEVHHHKKVQRSRVLINITFQDILLCLWLRVLNASLFGVFHVNVVHPKVWLCF